MTPKRLIEVDLPIKEISKQARREKSIRHGHIATLHIWWARRPLAACRAVVCAALWPDPADELCPTSFRTEAQKRMSTFWNKRGGENRIRNWENALDVRQGLLAFIAEFANWHHATNADFLETSRALTQAAHQALRGEAGTRPLVVDPFAGGGAIPLEALRVGADAFASDLNPVAVLLNKVVLQYIPRYGSQLAEAVRHWGQWIKAQAETELAEFYPKDPDGATPIAYLWARAILSEAPDEGSDIPIEIPLIHSLWLAKKNSSTSSLSKGHAFRWKRDAQGRVQTEIVTLFPEPFPESHPELIEEKKAPLQVRRPILEIFEPQSAKEVESGTVARGDATCPVTGYTTPVKSVRRQLKARNGGAHDARLLAVVTTHPAQKGRRYRLPTENDLEACKKAATTLAQRKKDHHGSLSLVPDEPLPPQGTLGFRVQLYGIETWGSLFTPRQALALTTLARLVRLVGEDFDSSTSSEHRKLSHRSFAPKHDPALTEAVQTCLAFIVDSCADHNASLCVWRPNTLDVSHVFGRQALPITWDFAEVNTIGESTGSFAGSIDKLARVISRETVIDKIAGSEKASATKHPLPDQAADCLFTDPPYYDAVPFADLSDFFYVWLKRTLPHLFQDSLTPKADECIVDETKGKDNEYFEKTMRQALAEGQRLLQPQGIGIVLFAHKTTSGWEAQLQAMIAAGWTITGSWPIDTEMGSRLRAQNSAALASSIHLVCRPRQQDTVGDWRDVLQALPARIHQWLPRLAQEGVAGADAIFACLGPALEIFSRYARVEKVNGEQVPLKEYLEQVWAVVAKEALTMIFAGADTSGFEEDARLTALWLWTLSAQDNGKGEAVSEEDFTEVKTGKPIAKGYNMEYDAARKIAQGLGVHLEKLPALVEIKGKQARLLPVSERTTYLFGKDSERSLVRRSEKRSEKQLSFLDQLDFGEELREDWEGQEEIAMGKTSLDCLHQSMLLFAKGRSETLKRFLVEDGIGHNPNFWQLAQAFSALYPTHTEEKRWVDGVLARKKSLGF